MLVVDENRNFQCLHRIERIHLNLVLLVGGIYIRKKKKKQKINKNRFLIIVNADENFDFKRKLLSIERFFEIKFEYRKFEIILNLKFV